MYYLIGASQEPHEVNRYHQNLKMETLCLPISFQKISPRWLMTIASLIVLRKDEWNHISKESSHLQSQSCTILRCSSRVSELAHWTRRESWAQGKRSRLKLEGEAGAEQAGAKHLTTATNHAVTQVIGRNTLSLGSRGGADKLQTLQVLVLLYQWSSL